MLPRAPITLLANASAAEFAAAVACRMGLPLTSSEDVWFSCGEGKHVISSNIRGSDVYIFQQPVVPGSSLSVYDRWMMLLHAVDTARHSDAGRVTVILPYLPGSRQDKRKGRTREGVSTGLFARLLQAAGVSMVVTVEPHNEAIAGCFDPKCCVFEPVYVTHAFGRWLASEGLVGDMVASTDVGGLQLARRFADLLQHDLVALSKERDYRTPNTVARTSVIGDVRGRNVLIIDDIIDTGGSAVAAVEALWANGAKNITLATIHPVFSGPAWERLSRLRSIAADNGRAFFVAGTSTIIHPDAPSWYRSFPLDDLLADVIQTLNNCGSVRHVIEED